ncbi:MAG: hypothetical protein JHC74_02805 [Thermoleophilia bacterium]|nr:hypothetical protein [Thermoleophilia bacterium]
MSTRGQRGVVIDAGPEYRGRALIGGREVDVVSLRRSLLACGDLVKVVIDGVEPVVVEVIGRGTVIPLLLWPGRLERRRRRPGALWPAPA